MRLLREFILGGLAGAIFGFAVAALYFGYLSFTDPEFHRGGSGIVVVFLTPAFIGTGAMLGAVIAVFFGRGLRD